MSEFHQIEENFETLKEVFVSMTQAIKQMEQQQSKMEKDNKTLSDTNKSLHESMERLLSVNEKHQAMLETLDKSLDRINALNAELEDVKEENLQLKDSINQLKNVQQACSSQCTDPIGPNSSSFDKLEKYNALLKKKIVDLENQILMNQASLKQSSNYQVLDLEKQLSISKAKVNTLQLENNSLKEQLSNFRTMHNQIVSEMRLNNFNNANGGRQPEGTASISQMIIDQDDENELQPLQVNVIDSDSDELMTSTN